ncbi:MAG: histidine phosphatase family protein [Cyanobacteria bacterium P01_A01_bin.83]
MSYFSTSPTFVTDSATPEAFSPTDKSATRVFLVRHGHTTYNEQERYQGNSDYSVLTDQGEQNAFATGLALQQFNFDAIYTSPLTRAQQTVQSMVSAWEQTQPNPAPILIEPKLTEICLEDWQGLTYKVVKAKFPEAHRCWSDTPHLFSCDGINFPVVDLFQAAEQFWQSILARHRGQTILIVAHGGTNRALISTAIGVEAEHYHSLQQSNCGISCLEFANGNRSEVELSYLNVTNHLQEKLPKLKAEKTGWRWLFISNSVTEDLLASSRLPGLMAQNFVNLIVTDYSQASENIAETLLQNNQQTIHLAVAQSGFLETWQRRISNQQKSNSASETASLTTGLIIADDKLLHDILNKTLGVNATLNTLKHLSIVHYPHANCQSILQGIIPLESTSIALPKL